MKTKPSPTLQVLRSEERGHANHGWLDSHHSFSFGSYHNPQKMGFRSLRVINQDRIAAGSGFPTHPHRDMEIFTYMLSGSLTHQDSMGNKGHLQPGQIQLMSAGTGVTHSEFNSSPSEIASFLQIWITPERQGLEPTYTEWTPSPAQRSATKSLIISPDGREQSAKIHQDARIYRLKMHADETVTHMLSEGRGLWIQLIHENLTANHAILQDGDTAFTEENGEISLLAHRNTEALLFDLK